MNEYAASHNAMLTTGWEPKSELDAGDTVVRRFLMNLAEFFASTAKVNGGWVHEHDQVSIATSSRPAAFFNSAVVLQPVVGDEWDVILECVDGVYSQGEPAEAYLWSVWPTPDLAERGWELEGHPPLLVRQPGGPIPGLPAGLDIRRVSDAEGLHDWEMVAIEGYPLGDVAADHPGCLLGEPVLHDERWRLWVGYDEGRPVSIGTQFVSHGFSQFALGVTLPEARGRGYWYGMIRERMLAEPDLLSGAVFSDDSRPGIEKLCYLPIIRFNLWRRPPR
jgi:hypothetical protein